MFRFAAYVEFKPVYLQTLNMLPEPMKVSSAALGYVRTIV